MLSRGSSLEIFSLSRGIDFHHSTNEANLHDASQKGDSHFCISISGLHKFSTAGEQEARSKMQDEVSHTKQEEEEEAATTTAIGTGLTKFEQAQ